MICKLTIVIKNIYSTTLHAIFDSILDWTLIKQPEAVQRNVFHLILLKSENQSRVERTNRLLATEGIVRLGNVGVISEFLDVNGDEMVFHARFVFDWHFREG